MPQDEEQVKAAVRAALSVFDSSRCLTRLPLAEPQTARGPSPAETEDVVLIPSGFPHRRAVMWVQAADRDASTSAMEGNEVQEVVPPSAAGLCVRPLSPRTGAASHPAMNDPLGPTTDTGEDAEAGRIIVKHVRREGGPHQGLRYVLAENATPFTALLATMALNGFAELPSRHALMDQTSWALKWIKPPARSEYVKMPLVRYQKLNHIPGTRRLGHKAHLHHLLTAAAQRWEHAAKSPPIDQNAAEDGMSPVTPGFHPRPPHRLFPEAWVWPDEAAACLSALRAPANAGQLFIVKPCGGAGGHGIFLLRGAATVSWPHQASGGASDDDTTRASGGAGGASTAAPRQWIVQRYVSRPYLIAGHKFDLRLYVLVTSYWPLRVYLYREGLVRIASSVYYAGPSSDEKKQKSWNASARASEGAAAMADTSVLTAHLTNFTINKAEASPSAHDKGERTEAAQGAAIEETEAWPGTKWSLAALAAYMTAMGDADYAATMRRVEDLLVRVFAAAVPDVRSDLQSVQAERRQRATASDRSVDSGGPACTFKGVSPFFEVYGVDVLLELPCADRVPSAVALEPVLMEVNIMPSLSTHYSRLDQSIKSHLVADALTVVGLSSPRLKPVLTPTSPVSTWPPTSDTPQPMCANRQRAFLSSLSHIEAVEACLTAEEEQRRAKLTRFACLAPTPTIFQTYWPLLTEPARAEARVSDETACGDCEARFDKLLSAWESAKTQSVDQV